MTNSLASGKWPRNVESPLRTTVYSVLSTVFAAADKLLQISVISALACTKKALLSNYIYPVEKQA